MRLILPVVLLLLACSSPSEPATKSILETTATAYVATDDPDPRFDLTVTVIVKHRNTSDLIVRVADCTTSLAHAPYIVATVDSHAAAWDPHFVCATFGTPYHDLAPGAERTDTLTLRAPWQRSFNGEPIGAMEGEFYIAYETQVCGVITRFGACSPSGNFEFARSNGFTISK